MLSKRRKVPNSSETSSNRLSGRFNDSTTRLPESSDNEQEIRFFDVFRGSSDRKTVNESRSRFVTTAVLPRQFTKAPRTRIACRHPPTPKNPLNQPQLRPKARSLQPHLPPLARIRESALRNRTPSYRFSERIPPMSQLRVPLAGILPGMLPVSRKRRLPHRTSPNLYRRPLRFESPPQKRQARPSIRMPR